MPDVARDARTIATAGANQTAEEQPTTSRTRIFLLSPANASGIKGQRLFAPASSCELALRLRNGGVALGEIYRFISSLYFRGKLEYAQRFQHAPEGVAGVQIITGAGLMLPETVITLERLQTVSATSIDAKNTSYRLPLDRDLLRLREVAGDGVDVILLGSVATYKYIDPIKAVFGERLLFPKEFLGVGDMSRGSMLLRSCAQGRELEYIPVRNIVPRVGLSASR
jgi:hypothetical protein